MKTFQSEALLKCCSFSLLSKSAKRNESYEKVEEPSLVVSTSSIKIYVGAAESACDASTLNRCKITHIINCTAEFMNFWESGEIERMFPLNEDCAAMNLSLLTGIDDSIQSQKWYRYVLEQSILYRSQLEIQPKYLHLILLDRPKYKDQLFAAAQTAIHFLEDQLSLAKQNNNQEPPIRVLIHCKQGISRSVSIAMAWMIKHMGLSSHEALQQIRLSRPKASSIKRYPKISHNFDLVGSAEHRIFLGTPET